ncbi:hypothetical protein JYU34_013749 [Plutella xylostella]|uniref:Peptidase S1 domain-containing protein n=1 Tax=Plutella xylostella TaxID=51655 RepID=A0ABQ7QAK7_PLUXY|nr:hypothetical protein JYU34_013749 [Plutella xylostella]
MRVFVLLAILGAALAAPQAVQRIVGGEDTLIQDYPFFVNVNAGGLGIWVLHCGGSLISEAVVLTSAGCLQNYFAFFLRVRVGSSAHASGDIIEVEDFKQHERWNSPIYENDVGLIFLKTRAELSENVGLARIPGASYTIADDTAVTAIGFGDLSADSSSNPDILQSVELFVINEAECARRYAYLQTQPGQENTPAVTSAMICTGVLDQGGKDFCDGDEGGPVVVEKDIVIGVASWRYKCGDAAFPSVNTRVSTYTDWILSNSGLN